MFEFLKRKKKKKRYEMQTVRLNDLLNFLGIDENSDRLQEVTYYTCLKVLSEGLSKLPLSPGGDRIYFNGSNIAVEDAGIQYREQEQSNNF